MSQKLVYVCEGGDCTERGSGDLFDLLQAILAERDPEEARVRVRRYPCFGGCEVAINITVYPDKIFYSQVKPEDLPEIVEHLLGESAPVDRLTGSVQPDVEEMVWMLLDSPY